VFLEGLLVFVDRDGHGYQCVGFYTIHIQTRIQNNYPNLPDWIWILKPELNPNAVIDNYLIYN
jgi:hypothetical protein